MEKYILVCIGVFADQKRTKSYRIFERDDATGAYHPAEGIENDPARLPIARGRLTCLREDERRAARAERGEQ